MSFSDISYINPDIDTGTQLARRQEEGIEDIYFRESSGDITKREDKPGQVDLTDEVVRRVDPKSLPLDTIDPNESYKFIDGKNYMVKFRKIGDQKIPYLQDIHYHGKDDTKYALIGGKLYEIEFETDPKTLRVSTYLTTSVGDLFNNDKFLKGASPDKKLEMLGKIKKASTFMTWYESGEYARYQREKEGGDASLHAEDIKEFALDDDLQKMENDLKKKVGVPGTDKVITSVATYLMLRGAVGGGAIAALGLGQSLMQNI